MNISISNVIPPNVPSSRRNSINFGNNINNTKLLNSLKRDSLILSNKIKLDKQ